MYNTQKYSILIPTGEQWPNTPGTTVARTVGFNFVLSFQFRFQKKTRGVTPLPPLSLGPAPSPAPGAHFLLLDSGGGAFPRTAAISPTQPFSKLWNESEIIKFHRICWTSVLFHMPLLGYSNSRSQEVVNLPGFNQSNFTSRREILPCMAPGPAPSQQPSLVEASEVSTLPLPPSWWPPSLNRLRRLSNHTSGLLQCQPGPMWKTR